MRVISFYLPQFHEVKENSEWWGEGFTDWVSVKGAQPLFQGHYQPHEPLNDNYYNLLNANVMKWQAKVMEEYGIDGQAIYHYWFKDGRKILEKPVEMLLQDKTIKMPFCLYWANESWIRSWSNIKEVANLWMMDDKKEGNDDGVLLRQEYGDEKDWKEHFDYLVQFFKDERYIRVDGKPLFIVYRSSIIPRLAEMIEYWRQLAHEYGLNGLYIIGAYAEGIFNESGLDAQLLHEPPRSNTVFWDLNRNSSVTKIDYDQIWNYVLQEYYDKITTYYTGFSGYDDTPRRSIRGGVLVNNSPDKFCKYMKLLMAKNEAMGVDITFVNAWNEWGEGMHLEPDKKYGYSYLNALFTAKKEYRECLGVIREKIETEAPYISILKNRSGKFEAYMNVLDKWLQIKEQGKEISEYFLKRGITNVSIYGYGILGRHLSEELKNTKVNVTYFIDKQKEKLQIDYPVFLPDEELPNCDVIVISAFYFIDEILSALPTHFKTVSLNEVINCLLYE